MPVVRIALLSLLLVGVSLAAIRTAAAQPAGPTCSITDNRVTEGQDDPFFHINCTNPTPDVVQISYATSDQTATAPDDYIETSGELDVPAGSSGQGIVVDVVDDADPEEEETFLVTLSDPDGVVTFDRQATGTIQDNDGQSNVPCILLSDTAVSVGGLAATPSQSRATRLEGLTVRNCGTDVNLEARATDATGAAGTWQLADYPRGNPIENLCELGPDRFAAVTGVASRQSGEEGVTYLRTQDQALLEPADELTPFVFPAGDVGDTFIQIAMPCVGSVGLGEPMTTQITLTAVAAP